MQEKTETTVQAPGLKVIGAGFGRTGTLSLKVALEQLGFGPCHHMVEAFTNPDDIEIWDAASQGKPVDWHKIFDRYGAMVDWPGCAFYAQLMEAYPDAKVILSVRDPQKWYESAYSTIYSGPKGTDNIIQRGLFNIIRLAIPRMRRIRNINKAIIWGGTFQGKFDDRAYAINVFNQHSEEVKRTVPPEKLLVFDVKEGWEPLCAFLGVDVPATPFPHLNDRMNFAGHAMQKRLNRIALQGLAGVGAVVLAVVLFFLIKLRKQ